MAFPITNLIGRFRTKVDLPVNAKDVLNEDGTSYTIVLSQSPILSGTDQVFISHPTFTTGLFQYVPPNGSQSLTYSSGNNLTYTLNLNRGEMSMYQGSGYTIGSGLVPFAPWNTSTLTVYYQASQYTDYVLAQYLSYAVASVEASLQIGMYVSGVSGVAAPVYRDPNDSVNYQTGTPYDLGSVYVIAEAVEILQELITKKALFDILSKERRIGAGNAIKIVDGDTQIDTSVNQKYLADLLKDTRADYIDMIKWVMMNMNEGYTIRQVNEASAGWGRGGGAAASRGAIGSFGTMNSSFPMDWS